MGAALSDPLWMASLGNKVAKMMQGWTCEALRKVADDMVVKRIQGIVRQILHMRLEGTAPQTSAKSVISIVVRR